MQTVLKCPAAQWSELHTGLQTDLADCAENHAHTGLVQGVEVADSILTILRGLTPLTGLVPLAGASGVIPVVLSLLDSLADLTKTKIQNRFDLLEVAVLLTWYLRLYHPLTKKLDPTPEVLYRLSRVLEDTAHLMEKLVKRGKHHIWSAIRNWFRAKKDARKIAAVREKLKGTIDMSQAEILVRIGVDVICLGQFHQLQPGNVDFTFAYNGSRGQQGADDIEAKYRAAHFLQYGKSL